MKPKLVFTYLLLLANICFGQHIKISGRIIDKKEKFPLAGVSVLCGNTGVLSNNNGFFTVETHAITNDSISFSYVGYYTKNISVKSISNAPLVIEMEMKNKELEAVIVSSGVENIIRKAVAKIPQNYSTKDFILNGISRQYQIVEDDKNVYRYYANDAVLKMFYPSYTKNDYPIKVSLAKNKLSFLQSSALQDSSRWVDGYFVVENNDFVHGIFDFINPASLKKYHYHLAGKTFINKNKVFIINFYSKSSGRTEGTVFIDTASYAFVAANYNRYNISRFRMRTIKRYSTSVEYSKTGDKWYISRINRTNDYANEQNIFGIKIQEDNKKIRDSLGTKRWRRSNDFITLFIDTSDLAPNKDSVKFVDRYGQDIDFNNIASDSAWQQYDSIFKEAQAAGKINYIAKPQITKENEKLYQPPKKTFLSKVINYMNNNNIRFSIGISSLPVTLSTSQPLLKTSIQNIANFAVSSENFFRLWRNLFFDYSAHGNAFAWGGIKSRYRKYGLAYEIKLSERIHAPVLVTSTGYSTLFFLNKKDKIYKSTFWEFGASLEKILGRRGGIFMSLHYNIPLKKDTYNIIFVNGTPLSAGMGYKLKL